MAEILSEVVALEAARARLAAGETVAIPTETVYGLAADAGNGEAVARIFAAKRRPRFNPLICHVADMAMARRIAVFSPLAERLAQAFWPGPLTLVLPLAAGAPVHPLVTAGLDSVGVRIPVGFARALIAAFGRPLAAPSANSSGRVSATSAEAVAADLGTRVGLIVDGGQSPVGVESTILKIDGDRLTQLRPGGLAIADIEKVAGVIVNRQQGGRVVAPGMLSSHYAPRASMRLDAVDVGEGEALLGYGAVRAAHAKKAIAFLNLSPKGDPGEAARNLFSHLRALDETGAAIIAVEPVSHTGLGEAINDRLARAAAPREGEADRSAL